MYTTHISSSSKDLFILVSYMTWQELRYFPFLVLIHFPFLSLQVKAGLQAKTAGDTDLSVYLTSCCWEYKTACRRQRNLKKEWQAAAGWESIENWRKCVQYNGYCMSFWKPCPCCATCGLTWHLYETGQLGQSKSKDVDTNCFSNWVTLNLQSSLNHEILSLGDDMDLPQSN